jgi:hypothetical protein
VELFFNRLGQFRVIVQIGAFFFGSFFPFFCGDLFGLGSLQLVSHPHFCFGAFYPQIHFIQKISHSCFADYSRRLMMATPLQLLMLLL